VTSCPRDKAVGIANIGQTLPRFGTDLTSTRDVTDLTARDGYSPRLILLDLVFHVLLCCIRNLILDRIN
jgi:hypothetical protein